MITGLRAALLCKKVEQRLDGQIDIIGISPDTLTGGSRPDLATLDLFLNVDFDGKGATGFVRLEAPHFSHRVPFATPSGVTNSGMMFTIMIPIVETGQLVVSVVDGSNRLKPFTAKWTLRFAPGAPDHGPDKIADAIRFCNDETTKLLTSLYGRAPETH